MRDYNIYMPRFLLKNLGLKMGVGKVILDTLADFGGHTTIGGICNAGLTRAQCYKTFYARNLLIFVII